MGSQTESDAKEAAAFVSESFNNGIKDEGKANVEVVEKPAGAAPDVAKTDGPASDAGESDAAGAGDEQAAETPAADAAPEVAPKPKPQLKDRRAQIQREIDDAIRRRTEARTAADAEEARLARVTGTKPAQTPLTGQGDTATSQNGRPDASKYQFGELDAKYIADVVKFETKAVLAEEKAAQEKSRQEEAARLETEKFNDNVKSTLDAGAAEFDDFVDLVVKGGQTGKYDLADDTLQLAVESPVGAQVLYHLASNPKEASELAAKPTERARAAAFGRLEAKFSAPAATEQPKPKIPKAQAPIQQPRGAGGKFSVGYESSNFEEVEAKWNATRG